MTDRTLYRTASSQPRRIDYDLMRRKYPTVRAALTRAQNSGDPLKVRAAVERFVKLSNDVGAMPDDWATWRVAMEDAWGEWSRSDAADADYYDNNGVELARWQTTAASFNY